MYEKPLRIKALYAGVKTEGEKAAAKSGGKRIKSLCLLLLLAAWTTVIPLRAQEWKTKPFTQWTAMEVTQVLIDSPWVFLNVYRLPSLSLAAPTVTRWYYRIRLLSAAPVIQAHLRYNMLVPDLRGMTIDYKDLAKETAQGLDEKFVRSHPDDTRLIASEEYIILSLTETMYRPYILPPDLWPPRHENTRPALCMDLQLSDLVDNTFLSTGGNRKVRIVKYERPSSDGLGAKFYFPRRLSSGKEWVNPQDKELRFTTRMRGKTITAKFDLRKLKLNGRLEI